METCSSNKYIFIVFQFKSYYVVWKRDRAQDQKSWEYQFKSYYVVWKLSCQAAFCAIVIGFKSYYVVWKPGGWMMLPLLLKRLNRTMQYGNKSAVPAPATIGRFKSYYVVWKLRSQRVSHCSADCLNRTMQYGNNKGRYSIKCLCRV